MKLPSDPHYRHCFPAEIISHAVWLNHVLSLSLRDPGRAWHRRVLRSGATLVQELRSEFLPIACATPGNWSMYIAIPAPHPTGRGIRRGSGRAIGASPGRRGRSVIPH